MDMVMFDLQTAAIAAAGNAASGIPAISDADGEGRSFSEVLAAQTTENAAAKEVPADAEENAVPDEGYVIPEEYLPKNIPVAFGDIFGQLEKADFGMQKGMKMLLDTVIKAVQGPNDGKQRKTDLFSMFYDNSSSLFGEDEDMFLLCGEFMSQISTVVSLEQEADSEEDDIIAGLAEILKRMSAPKKNKDEEEEEDEKAAADILAALISPPVTESGSEEYVFEDKAELVETVKEILSYPKQAVAEAAPEKAEKMEKLYADYKAATPEKASEESEYRPEPIRMSFSGVKINNAAEQIETITGASETAASAMQMPQFIQTVNEVPEMPEEEFPQTEISVPVEDQVIETVSERLFELTDDGTEELVMVLKPEHLGQVAIRLVKENGAVSVTLSAQHAEVGRMMAERAAELSSGLESKDVEVKSVEVVNPSNAAAQMGLDFTNQGFSRRQEYSSEGNRSSYRGIQSVTEADETDGMAETENIMIREAKLWTQA